MRIACVGGGPAGLYFTILMKLHDQRHDITLFERNAAGYTYGWGVVFWDDLLETLQRSDTESGRTIRDSARRWSSQVVEVQGTRFETGEHCGYSIGRQRLLDILTERARNLGVRFEFEQEVKARSELPECDLIVACDGVNSRLREADADEFGTSVHVGRNKYIWLGTDKVFDSFIFAFARTDPGWIWCHAYGVDANSSTFIVECPSEVWSGLGFGSMSADDTLAALEEIFRPQLGGHRLFGKFRDGQAAPWLNFRTFTSRKWNAGKLVLMGDAAHTTHFTIGSGTKLAIEDAVALANKLQERREMQDALQAYARDRQTALQPLQADARLSAQWFEDVSRYLELPPEQFSILLLKRRSPLLHNLSPRLYLRLLHATEESAVLQKLWKYTGPGARSLYSRRKSGLRHGLAD